MSRSVNNAILSVQSHTTLPSKQMGQLRSQAATKLAVLLANSKKASSMLSALCMLSALRLGLMCMWTRKLALSASHRFHLAVGEPTASSLSQLSHLQAGIEAAPNKKNESTTSSVAMLSAVLEFVKPKLKCLYLPSELGLGW